MACCCRRKPSRSSTKPKAAASAGLWRRCGRSRRCCFGSLLESGDCIDCNAINVVLTSDIPGEVPMASLTVRQLDDKLKKLLRLRAARHSRSMEDEVRVILREAADQTGHDILEHFEPPSRPTRQKARAAEANGNRVLLIIGGGIAAYKSLDLIRRLQDRGAHVRCILTAAAQHFVTPLAAGALAGERAYTDLFDAHSEFDVGHIRLARDTDLVVVAPATADLIARMAGGHADDLATAVLLATDKPVLIAPAMNPQMWVAKATQRNFAQLAADGIHVVGPNVGEMAERGEAGLGRMAEPLEIATAVEALLRPAGPLTRKR